MHRILTLSGRNFFFALLLFLALPFAQLITIILSESVNNYYYYPVILLSYLFLLTLLKWPENALYLVVVLSPLQSFMITSKEMFKFKFPWIITLWFMDMAAFICLVALIVKLIRKDDKNMHVCNSYHLPIFILCSYSLLSFLWMKNIHIGLYTFIKLIVCVLLFYAPVILVKEKKQLIRIVGLFFFSGVIAAAGGIISTMMKGGLNIEGTTLFKEKISDGLKIILAFYPSFKLRAQGFAFSNFLSFSLSLSFICGLYFLTRVGWGLKKILILIVLGVFLYAQIHTLSKGGIVAFAIGTAFFIFSNALTKRQWPKYLIIFFFALLLFFFTFSIVKLGGGMGRLSAGISERLQSSWGTRLYMWEKGLEHFLDTYGIGTGIGGVITLTTLNLHAHNAYLGSLFELGVVGFFMYLSIYYIFISQIRRFNMLSDKEFNPLFTTFTAILVVWSLHSLIEFDYYLLRIPWFIFGLAVATIKLKVIHERSL
jgi:O-antigen ligase